MFPIRDTIPTKKFPIVNCALIVINILAFLFQISLSEGMLNELIMELGLVPGVYTRPEIRAEYGGSPFFYLPFLTNMFLHGGWMHLIGNVWTLYIFGDNVEDRMGRIPYLVFYLLCGVLASSTHLFFNWDSMIPAIGASGAISGVMGAYLFLCKNSRIVMLFPIFYIPFFFKIPAWAYLVYWFVLQLVNGTAEIVNPNATGGIAFWAHIGGFVAGVLLYRLFESRSYTSPDPRETYKHTPREVQFKQLWE